MAARPLLFVLLFLAQQENQWVEFQSRETEKPPRLIIDGKEFTATADTLLISYLATGSYGSMTGLAVSLGDTNRALIQFDLDGVKGAAKAELVLELKLSKMPPTQPFDLGVYAPTAEWSEQTSWNAQPTVETDPAATASIAPKAGEVRIDVTALVKRWVSKKLANHGVLLKVTAPAGAFEARLRSVLPWAASPAAAKAAAEKEGKRVLAFHVVEDDPKRLSVGECSLLAAFAHPDLLALVKARYVPVRIVVGLDAKPKPPALVVSSEVTLASIGTYDVDLLLAFLRRALTASAETDPWKLAEAGALDQAKQLFEKAGSKEGLARVAALAGDHATAVKSAKGAAQGASLVRLGRFDEARAAFQGLDDPQALYLIGCLEWRDREEARALAAWKAVVKKHAASPWALKASARLEWPQRMAAVEPLESVEPAGATTEVAAKDAAKAMERAADYLVGQQLADGTWPIPITEGEMYRAAVTALSAHALFAWSDAFADARKKRAVDAVSRATDWMRTYIAKADPAEANAWGGAYVLDYFTARFAVTKAFKGSVEKSVALLLGGQMKNGAWSYSLNFGNSWKGGNGWPKTDKGRAHSMNTGPALIALGQAKKAGVEVDAKALEKGREALMAMRKKAGVYTYTWPDPDSFSELDQSIGRAPGCEHALLLLGAGGEKDAGIAIDAFMKWRADLRVPVKITGGWIPPRCVSAYFYHFSYYHAARLIEERGGDGAKQNLKLLRDDLLAVVEADGTWVDYQESGKAYATAMAMLVMKLGT